ncbi:MAG: hypothetical protein HQM14_10945 [SAR324 cluster bacterium]|nr:hypothetical protein [SAR324 cluster bacterium]
MKKGKHFAGQQVKVPQTSVKENRKNREVALNSNKKRRRLDHWNSRRVTTFYPQYSEGRDRVEPIRSVFPTMFQEVIPRYNLSATDTRDEGVGPMFEEVPYAVPRYRRKASLLRSPSVRPAKRRKHKIRVNFSV